MSTPVAIKTDLSMLTCFVANLKFWGGDACDQPIVVIDDQEVTAEALLSTSPACIIDGQDVVVKDGKIVTNDGKGHSLPEFYARWLKGMRSIAMREYSVEQCQLIETGTDRNPVFSKSTVETLKLHDGNNGEYWFMCEKGTFVKGYFSSYMDAYKWVREQGFKRA